MGTAAQTVLMGVTIFSLGQIIVHLFIEPLLQHRRVVGEIDAALTYYANAYGNAEVLAREDWREASQTTRRLSAELSARTNAVLLYRAFALVRLVPERSDVQTAVGSLIGLSNSGRSDMFTYIENNTRKIREALRIPRGSEAGE